MNIESKVLRLEREIFGRGNGATAWALELAEETIRIRHLYRPNLEALEKALLREDPTYQPPPQEPHPISDSNDGEQVAAILLERFRVRENYEEWQQRRYEAGSKRLGERLKAIEAEGKP